jgi:hypothetical protein
MLKGWLLKPSFNLSIAAKIHDCNGSWPRKNGEPSVSGRILGAVRTRRPALGEAATPPRLSLSVYCGRGATELDLPQQQRKRNRRERDYHQRPEDVDIGQQR